ncbi:MAG: Asd/ArgC dimerization domain-containing protein [Christensenellales bacterium]
MVALRAVRAPDPIDTMVACTYQAVSGAGQGGIKELEDQLHAYAQGEPLEHKTSSPARSSPTSSPRSAAGWTTATTEEMKMQNEGRRSCTCPS